MTTEETMATTELTERVLCNWCEHPIDRHGPDGCEVERTVQIEGSSETFSGPCGCQEVTEEI
jgi:hypothetical protein